MAILAQLSLILNIFDFLCFENIPVWVRCANFMTLLTLVSLCGHSQIVKGSLDTNLYASKQALQPQAAPNSRTDTAGRLKKNIFTAF